MDAVALEQIARLQAENTELKAIIAALNQRIAELEARLNQNSSNSHRAPSTDGPHVKPAASKTSSGRRRGAQPGHEILERKILPPDTVHDYRPQCRCCGIQLCGDDPNPIVNQVIELPAKLRHVTHHRRHKLTCPTCRVETLAPPVAEAASGFGPRLQVATAYLSSACRLGKRAISKFYGEVCDIPMSPGSVCKQETKVSAAIETIHAEALEWAQGRDANLDETGWRQSERPSVKPEEGADEIDREIQEEITSGAKSGKKNKAWLWVAVTPLIAVFLIRLKRDRAAFDELAGATPGVITTDRYSVYQHLPPDQRQICWSHLRRDFQAMIDRKDAGSEIGEGLLVHADILFKNWQRVRDGTLTRRGFKQTYAGWLREEVKTLLARGAACGCAKTAGVCGEILKVEESLWTFASRHGVEPTNNAAERALRHGVCWRKTSYGTDSERGSRFVERMLTVISSCRLQERDVFEFLVQSVEAREGRAKRPSLIPIGA